MFAMPHVRSPCVSSRVFLRISTVNNLRVCALRISMRTGRMSQAEFMPTHMRVDDYTRVEWQKPKINRIEGVKMSEGNDVCVACFSKNLHFGLGVARILNRLKVIKKSNIGSSIKKQPFKQSKINRKKIRPKAVALKRSVFTCRFLFFLLE